MPIHTLGLDIHSRIVAEHNSWQLPPGVTVDKLIRRLKGNAIAVRGSTVNGQPVDLLAAWAAAHSDEKLSPDIGRRPEDTYGTAALQPAEPNRLVGRIRAGAGPRRA